MFQTITNDSGYVTSQHSVPQNTTDRYLRDARRAFIDEGWCVSDAANKSFGFATLGDLDSGLTRVDWTYKTRYAPASWDVSVTTLTQRGRDVRA